MRRTVHILETPPQWASRAEPHIATILLDQAHCEKRAASTALGFIFRYPEQPELVKAMTGLCREELQHFAQVQDVLSARGIEYAALPPSSYAGDLMSHTRTDGPGKLVDHLLAAALIEARSCERFELLAEGLEERSLVRYFRKLAEAEGRHHETYLELAARVASREEVEARLHELAAAEGQAAARCTPEPRLHGSFGLLSA
jgi:tRNA 2-(methylsulfanyl)-N6-isopentenyladenosine37 hydroxylase